LQLYCKSWGETFLNGSLSKNRQWNAVAISQKYCPWLPNPHVRIVMPEVRYPASRGVDGKLDTGFRRYTTFRHLIGKIFSVNTWSLPEDQGGSKVLTKKYILCYNWHS